jgi:nucleoside phosphorylase
MRHNRDLLGIDMETYAVYHAAFQSRRPKPTAVSLKAVCDFADPDKNDGFQPYAAFVSAQVIRNFVEAFLFNPL